MECQDCEEEQAELTRVKVGRRILRLCEQCADERREREEIAREAGTLRRVALEYKE